MASSRQVARPRAWRRGVACWWLLLAMACSPEDDAAPACEAADDDSGVLMPQDETLPFPVPAEPFDTPLTFLTTRGHGGYDCAAGVAIEERTCPLDISALRWDPAAGSYTRSRTRSNEPRPMPFSDDVMWGMPLVSPVDGVVVACWRGMPDDDDDSDDVNCPGGDGECIQGGNHLNILSDDGELFYFGHLQQGSIPFELCPIDEVYLYDSDPKHCGLGEEWAGLRQSSRLDLRGGEVEVTAGQLVGRVGASGNGQGVHVHVHRKPFEYDDDGNPCEAPSLPLAFTQWWIQDRDGEPGGDWVANHGQPLPVDGRSWLLWPGPLGEPPRPDTCE